MRVHDADDPPVSDSMWDRLAALPDLDEAPLDEAWLPRPEDPPPRVEITQNRAQSPTPPLDATAPSPTTTEPPRDQRRFHVSAPPGSVGAQAPAVAPVPPEIDEPELPLPEPRRPRRRRWPRVLLAFVLILLVAAGGFVLYAWILWNQVDTVDTAGALSPASDGFTNYLIVGTDSREGVSADLDTADSIGLRVAGERSDTMVVLHIGDGGNHMVSLPRDLWVPIDGGAENKLNAARSIGGVPALIRTVAGTPGIPVHHYLEVDLAGFLSVIEAVGSITIDFDAPACDPKSGLDVRTTGPVALDAEQALAYVRSRTYTEFDAGAATGMTCRQLRRAGLGRTAGNSDFGRTERQREFLLAVFDRVSGTRNPVTMLRVLDGLADGLRVDESMGMMDAFGLLRDLRGLDATSHNLPVSDATGPGGASILVLNGQSAEVLDLVR